MAESLTNEKPANKASTGTQDVSNQDEKTFSSHEENVHLQPKRNRSATGLISRLGNLPEWRLGKEKLHGRSLNFLIASVSATAFLMFGYGTYSTQSLMRHLQTIADQKQTKAYCLRF